jgi:hypothetical protein
VRCNFTTLVLCLERTSAASWHPLRSQVQSPSREGIGWKPLAKVLKSTESSGNVQTLRFQVYRKSRPTSTLQVCSTRSRMQLKMVIEYGKRGFSRDFAQPSFAKLSCQMRGDGKDAKLHKAMSKGSLCEPLFCPPGTALLL